MSKITIKGTDAYDGEWELDENFTNGEYHKIWQLCGVAGGELYEALNRGHVGLRCALAAVALERLGKFVDFQILMDAQEIPEIKDDVEDDASPPVLNSGDGSTSDAAEKKPSSGPSGKNGSGNEAPDQSRTGTGSSPASPTSEQPTSAT